MLAESDKMKLTSHQNVILYDSIWIT